ncbi:MAG: hypothetical protein M3271_01590, partial [Actinomycetota bacterium]|nr:hypothetical protein [Actinomycetota bacterium]
MRSKRWVALALAVVLSSAGGPGRATPAQDEDASNVRLVQRYPYSGGGTWVGTEVAFDGRFVYGGHMGARGGVHVFDTVGGRVRQVGFFRCPAEQNDVAVVRPGLIAVAYEAGGCGAVQEGVQLLDVGDPARIRVLGGVEIPGGTHTVTAYPGTNLVYASPGGYWIEGDQEVVIDASDPDEPEVVAELDSGVLVGCHDLSFHLERTAKLALCAGEGATQIWDVSDPLAPAVLSEIDNPLITFHHSAVVSPDGKYLVIGDERWLGTSQGACGAPANHPTGALWIYDIADPRLPVLVSHFGLRRSGLTSACSAHDFAFVPGTRKLVAGWYEGGMNVVDLADPRNPVEVAHFRGEGADYWAAYW